MKSQRAPWLLILFATLVFYAEAQQASDRDPQALSVLARSNAALGRVPADCTVSGTVNIALGIQQETGTFRLLTRGTSQVSEEIQTEKRNSRTVFNEASQKRKRGSSLENLSWEYALSSEPATVPFAELQTVLANNDYALSNLGEEKVNGIPAVHLRYKNTFPQRAKLQKLSEYTERDLWVDASTWLPLKLSTYQRSQGGSAPRLLIELYFSDYRKVSGVTYPFFVLKSVNGVPQSTFKTSNVSFDRGLSDSDFDIQ